MIVGGAQPSGCVELHNTYRSQPDERLERVGRLFEFLGADRDRGLQHAVRVGQRVQRTVTLPVEFAKPQGRKPSQRGPDYGHTQDQERHCEWGIEPAHSQCRQT